MEEDTFELQLLKAKKARLELKVQVMVTLSRPYAGHLRNGRNGTTHECPTAIATTTIPTAAIVRF